MSSVVAIAGDKQIVVVKESTAPQVVEVVSRGLRGLQGEKGDEGIQGPVGPKGDTGPVGPGNITTHLTNEGHIFPADYQGNVLLYTTAGTMLTVMEGAERLVYDGVGILPGTWTYSLQTNNITPGLMKVADGGKRLSFETPSGVSPGQDSSSISFNINGTSSQGVPFFLSPKQTLVKARQGAMGPQGPKGDTGDTGLQGPKGDTGIQGDAGNIGPQGIQGEKGDTGDTGTMGPQGPQGPQGPEGLKGDKGDMGDTGPMGPQGLQGIQGPQGPMGLTGPQGDTGPQGEVGPQGPIGPQGLKGDKGDKGDTGPAGPAGTVVYPGAGIPVSTGTSWGSSKTAPAGDVVGTFDGQVLANKTLINYAESVFALSGTTPVLSPIYGPIQTWTLSGASTPTAGTWAGGQSITLMVDDGSAGTINWTSIGVTWKTGGGVAPTLNTTGYTVIALWKVGTTIYGARVGDA